MHLVSIVVPCFNEENSVAELQQQISTVCDTGVIDWELIFVDDGSTDASPERIQDLCDKDGRVGLVQFKRNFGKAAALDAGFKRTTGDVVITMDADLQDDPNEIPRFLEMIEQGFDVVSGWKQFRHDPINKRLPSKVFNAVVSRASGVKLHDFNCGFKAYRRDAVADLHLYGELHRFVPVLLHWRGFRVGELIVDHRPRRFGRSKYGMERLLKGFMDLLTVILTTRFISRPLHVFGYVGIVFGLAGFACLAYLTVLWFAGLGPIGDRPLLLLGMLLVVVGVQMFSIGLLGELVQHHRSTEPSTYAIKNVRAPIRAATTPTKLPEV